MNLTTQDKQVACFANAAAHLEPGGCFVIGVGVPQLQRLPPGRSIRVFEATAARLCFDEYDVASQGLISHHYCEIDGKLEMHSLPCRYVWPSELDLMARLAGLTLRERWGGWRREPFTSNSTMHVSAPPRYGAAPCHVCVRADQHGACVADPVEPGERLVGVGEVPPEAEDGDRQAGGGELAGSPPRPSVPARQHGQPAVEQVEGRDWAALNPGVAAPAHPARRRGRSRRARPRW